MSMIVNRGRVPRTPHTEFYSEPEVLALEEVHCSIGFSGDWSRKYHYRQYPTRQIRAPHKLPLDIRPQALPPLALQPWHLRTSRLKAHGDVISGRVPMIYGTNTFVYTARFERSCPADRFVRNGDGHELWFVQEGRGLLACEYGVLAFRPGHYLVIPKGTTYRVELESEECHLLMIESRFPFRFGPEHLTLTGQAALTAPIVETETDIPEFRPPRDEEGEFRVWTKHGGGFVTEIFLGHHPFDLIGWEGALFPYTVHVDDLHLLSRRVRVSPIAHRTFASGLSADSEIFIGTIKDQIGGWHEQAIAVDYARHNVDCDEVLFHANTNGSGMEYVEPASLTLHPGALAQSPRGLAAKYSLAERGKPSDGLSIALHTMFQPLSVAKQAFSVADKDYATSWNLDAQGSQPKG